jgi:[acyl-carrier-protein] S-malonyltransferase
VRWVESVQAMCTSGVQVVVECGPGKALSGMVKRINAEITSCSVLDLTSLQESQNILID